VWQRLVLKVVPSAEAGFVVIVTGVSGQPSAPDTAWFDDVHVYDLAPEARHPAD
jgi:hypothetical protein